MEAVQGVQKRLAAGNNGVDVDLRRLPQIVERVVLQQIMPQRQECGSTVINDEGGILVEESFHKRVECPLVYPVVLIP